MMVDFRENPPKELAGSEILTIRDYKSLQELNVRSGVRTPIEQDASNVLQWITADGTIVSVRPSGTEPKIKFYFGVKAPLCCPEKFEEVEKQLDQKIEDIKKELNLV
jgi:phosphoglucomutase